MGNIQHKSKLGQEEWHSFEESEIFRELDSTKDGLTSEEAEKRLKFYGENVLPS